VPPAAANRERASAFMEAAGIDAIVSWRPVSVRYLTGYWCWLAPLFEEFMVAPGGSGRLAMRNLALLPRGGETCLVVDAVWALNAVELAGEVRVAGGGGFSPAVTPASAPEPLRGVLTAVTGEWPADPFEALAAAVVDRGLGGSRLGVELDGVPEPEREALRARLPGAELVDATNLLRLVRAVKTADEIGALRRSAAIAERAAEHALAAAGASSTPSALADSFRRGVADAEADVDHFALAPRGLGLITQGSVPLGTDEAMYADFGCVADGWYSDSGTTLCVGEPDVGALAEHAAAFECVAAGAAAIAPGVPGSAVQAAMAAAFAERGVTGSFPHGHGLGLSVRDYPVLVPDTGARIRDDCVDVAADLALEPGMVVNLEAPVLTPGVRSVHCERTFVVTATGCEPLLDQPREQPIAGAGR
jgi:Xaa-Pro dipeptidase